MRLFLVLLDIAMIIGIGLILYTVLPKMMNNPANTGVLAVGEYQILGASYTSEGLWLEKPHASVAYIKDGKRTEAYLYRSYTLGCSEEDLMVVSEENVALYFRDSEMYREPGWLTQTRQGFMFFIPWLIGSLFWIILFRYSFTDGSGLSFGRFRV
ncbi:MAG: hypothetical protein M1150_04165 [Patescibacteria group bacterium]|nr:hypothetical protein [Patescibacteria group bacterium]